MWFSSSWWPWNCFRNRTRNPHHPKLRTSFHVQDLILNDGSCFTGILGEIDREHPVVLDTSANVLSASSIAPTPLLHRLEGKCRYRNGKQFEGTFCLDKPYSGKYTTYGNLARGQSRIQVEMYQGKTNPHCNNGIIEYTDGRKYKGSMHLHEEPLSATIVVPRNIQYYIRHGGFGVLTFSDGLQLRGSWHQDQFVVLILRPFEESNVAQILDSYGFQYKILSKSKPKSKSKLGKNEEYIHFVLENSESILHTEEEYHEFAYDLMYKDHTPIYARTQAIYRSVAGGGPAPGRLDPTTTLRMDSILIQGESGKTK